MLGVVEVGLSGDAVLDDTELVIKTSSLFLTGDTAEIILLSWSHDHDLPLLAVQRHASVL